MPTKPLSHSQRLGRTARDQAYDAQRLATPALAEAKRVRSSARWRNVRSLVLSAAPLCVDPYGRHASEGRVELATQVDHIIGIAVAPERAFELANLQPLCGRCHGQKSADERRGADISRGTSSSKT